MLPESVNEALTHVWAALRPLKHPTALVGGVALSLWGHARFTKDVDFLVGVEPDEVAEVVDAMRTGHIIPRRFPPAVSLGGLEVVQFDYELPDSAIEVRVDLQFPKEPFFRRLLDRRVSRQLSEGQEPIDVVACEDLILLKLFAGRIIDRSDASYLIRSNGPTLDLAYLTEWAGKLGVSRELNEVWDEAFPGLTPPQLPGPQ